jgi:DNA repair exonuclease SbcCD ATPase subunit
VDAEVKALGAAAEDLDKRERKLAEGRAVLDSPPSKHDALESAATVARQALEEALNRLSMASSERDIWGARQQERRIAAAGTDIDALQRAEDAARAAAKDDGDPVDEAAIASARKVEENAQTRSETLTGELRKAEGALLASGGAPADERLRDLEAALQRAHERQTALDDEYEAWKLLSETLKNAERLQATHLGNVLAPDLGARLQALAGQRYGGIALGPHLGLEGIEAAGGRRELKRLSIGTREQLSTLFRLCLAERLGSALVVDDQLVQSDPDRLRWFRRALRETASTGVQVVVVTCRPDDYLEPAESPAPHVVDLGSVVTDGT